MYITRLYELRGSFAYKRPTLHLITLPRLDLNKVHVGLHQPLPFFFVFGCEFFGDFMSLQ